MIIAGGCGGAEQGGRPADVWARDFCAAMSNWDDSSNARYSEFRKDWTDLQSSNANLSEFRDLIVDQASDQIVLTTQALESIRAAGHPDVEKGAEATFAMYDAWQEWRGVQVDYRDAARDLPVDDPDAFTQKYEELDSLVADFQGMVFRPGQASAPEVLAAARAEAACRELM